MQTKDEQMKEYIAVDLGASNGRTILGRYNGEKIKLTELNRFENNFVRVGESYYWDVLYLFERIKDGLKQYVKVGEDELIGIGIDTWGVDFGLIDKQGRLVGNPRAYRDPRGRRGMNSFIEKYGERAAFDVTGIANMEFNTIYQLYDMVLTDDPALEIADKLLLMPDLLAYMLCGEVSCEYTHASTTQMLGSNGEWSEEIIDMIGIKQSLLPKIQKSGTVKGTLLPHIAQEAGLKDAPSVYCVGSHDTASAVASVPAQTESFAFLSSGTWSLIGMMRKDALINDVVYDHKFSNEGTISGDIRLLENIMGMWIIQNCKREWDKEQLVSWDDVVDMAKSAPQFASLIDVTAQEFYDGKAVIETIAKYCEDTRQPVPQTMGEIARCVYESMAMSYKEAFLGLEKLKGGRIDVLHIVGGGANNKFLNQMSANALDREVIAGPSEATAIGNLMVQVKASGELADMGEMRKVIRKSCDVETYEPIGSHEWAAQYERYVVLKQTERE
jgi:rhamnulokinase